MKSDATLAAISLAMRRTSKNVRKTLHAAAIRLIARKAGSSEPVMAPPSHAA